MFNLYIADDEKLVIDTLQSIINWEDYEMKLAGWATNGKTAYEEIVNHEIDVVIVDIRMPGMNGLELIERVKESKQNTIFIVCSGYSDFNYAKEAMKHGTVYYLSKPVEITELLDAVQIAVKRCKEIKDSSGEHINQLKTEKMLFESIIYGQYYQESDFDNFFVASTNLENLPDYLNILDTVISKAVYSEQHQIKHFYNQNEIIVLFTNLPDYSVASEALQKITQEIKEKLNIETSWGVGANKPYAQSIHMSYIQSKKAYTYAVFTDERISNINDFIYATNHKLDIDYPKILDGLTTPEHVQQTEAYIHAFIDNALRIRVSPDALIYHCTEIINYATNYFKQLYSVPPELLYQHNYASIKHLSEVKSARLMGAITFDCLVNMMDFVNAQMIDYKDKVIGQIKEYVNGHINKSICAADICKVVNFNPTYISNFFKKKTGITLSDYIIGIKMEKAKQLLSNSLLKINKVAEEVGYDDQRYFCLVFKKFCGLTPTKFRDRRHPDKIS
jgi:two-component system response regulator YesN